MSISLGNKKPKELIEVEKVIWRALFTLSEGTKAPEDVLGDMVHQISWQTIEPPFATISQDIAEWFITAPSPTQVPLLTASGLLENIPMDQSPDYQLQSPTRNPSQAMEDPPRDVPTPRAGDTEEATASPVPNNNTMDPPSLTQAPLSTASGLLENIPMDQSPDYQPQSPTRNPSQAMEDPPSDVPTPRAGDTKEADMDQTPRDTEVPPRPTAPPVPNNNTMDQTNSETDDAHHPTAPPTPNNNTHQTPSETGNAPRPTASPVSNNNTMDETPDYSRQPPTLILSQPEAMEATPCDNTTSRAGQNGEAESLEVTNHRRSTRLASEKRKESSLHPVTPDDSSRSTSPADQYLPKNNQPTTPLKRKVPIGEEKSLSPGDSHARPIDVDALYAVMERYPLKREPQVCRSRQNFQQQIADEFSSS
jgi:hypothetical protein